MAPYIPMLFMGEEWATSVPFLYFADHEDEEMRQLVAEGRKKEFAAFGFDGDIPNPEEPKTYEMSKLKWAEQREGKHAEMLAWVKTLIKFRRSRVCFNDGDMHHLVVSRDDKQRTLCVIRDEARILINLGEKETVFGPLEGEQLELASQDAHRIEDEHIVLPPMSLAVLLSTTEEAEDRQVSRRSRDSSGDS